MLRVCLQHAVGIASAAPRLHRAAALAAPGGMVQAPPDWNDTSSEPKHLRAAAEAARQRWPGCCESAALNDISMEALAHEACECPADALSQPKGRQALSVSSSSPERDCSESHEIQQLKMKLAEMERNVQVARDERVEAVRTAVEAQQGQMAAMHSEREALAAQDAVLREAGQSQRNAQGMRLRRELEEETRRLKSRCRLECEEQAAARIAAEGRLRRCEEDAEDKSEQYQQKLVQLRRKFVQLRGAGPRRGAGTPGPAGVGRSEGFPASFDSRAGFAENPAGVRQEQADGPETGHGAGADPPRGGEGPADKGGGAARG